MADINTKLKICEMCGEPLTDEENYDYEQLNVDLQLSYNSIVLCDSCVTEALEALE